MNENIVTATIAETRDTPTKEHILARLRDWRARVHMLYDSVRSALGEEYSYDRSGKHRSAEEMVQRAGLKQSDVPSVDTLRIERDGRLFALLEPRGLWIIGANGRVDLVITPKSGGRRVFMLIDHSLPMSGESDWRIVRPSDRLQQPPFRPERFHELLE